jgi:hypothetical protein
MILYYSNKKELPGFLSCEPAMTNEPDLELHQHLRQLARRTCSCPPGSKERRQHLDFLIQELKRSGKLWRGAGLPQDAYEDILQGVWRHFCENLCKTTTARVYDPERASPLTWINFYIKKRILEHYAAGKKGLGKRVYPKTLEDGSILDPIDLIPFFPPESSSILQDVQAWIRRESVALRRVHVRDRPDVHCEVVISSYLLQPGKIPWKQLAQEFAISQSTLESFYRRECLPRLKAAAKQLGYL